jgi:hypothetical protein
MDTLLHQAFLLVSLAAIKLDLNTKKKKEKCFKTKIRYRVRYEGAVLTEVALLTLPAGPTRKFALADGPLLSSPSCAPFSQGPQHDLG